jgi:hypothetical protein
VYQGDFAFHFPNQAALVETLKLIHLRKFDKKNQKWEPDTVLELWNCSISNGEQREKESRNQTTCRATLSRWPTTTPLYNLPFEEDVAFQSRKIIVRNR